MGNPVEFFQNSSLKQVSSLGTLQNSWMGIKNIFPRQEPSKSKSNQRHGVYLGCHRHMEKSDIPQSSNSPLSYFQGSYIPPGAAFQEVFGAAVE